VELGIAGLWERVPLIPILVVPPYLLLATEYKAIWKHPPELLQEHDRSVLVYLRIISIRRAEHSMMNEPEGENVVRLHIPISACFRNGAQTWTHEKE
jgi:hypothetical protein